MRLKYVWDKGVQGAGEELGVCLGAEVCAGTRLHFCETLLLRFLYTFVTAHSYYTLLVLAPPVAGRWD